jgi:cation:H+ antiporter
MVNPGMRFRIANRRSRPVGQGSRAARRWIWCSSFGSNIFNILFILGVAALTAPLIVSRQLIRQDVPIMIVVSAAAVLMTLDGRIGKMEAVLLFVGLLVYTAFLFYQGRKQGAKAAGDEVVALIKDRTSPWRNFLLVTGGLVLLVLGARWLVQSAVEIAYALGVSEAVIGLTIIAAGTSLPEVMTSVIATLKGERDIAIGNVVAWKGLYS